MCYVVPVNGGLKMSAYGFEPIPSASADTSTALSLTAGQAPDGAFLEIAPPATNVEPGSWPLISFDISDQHIFGNKLCTDPDNPQESFLTGTAMSTTSENRLRSATRNLQAAVPGLVDTYMIRKSKGSEPRAAMPAEICKDVRHKLNDFLHKKTSKEDAAPLRSTLVSEATLISTFAKEYRDTNHPVQQLMDEIAARNELRQSYLDEQPNFAIRVLSQNEMEKLCDELILVVEGPRILETAKQLVDTKLKQLAAQLAIEHT